MNNSHVLNEDLSKKIKTTESDPVKFVPIEDFLEELSNKSSPWYEDIFNAIVYRLPYKIGRKWDGIFDFWERGRKGYCRRDVWNLYVHLSEMISNSTLDLIKETHGYPPSLEEDEWEPILLKISKGFAKIVELENSGEEPSEEDMKQIDESFDLLKKYFYYLWD